MAPAEASLSWWLHPQNRPEIIDTLINGVDRYNPSNIGILEDYLYHQIRSNEYDCLANLAILKLYQFNTDLYNADVVINVLLKAMTASPMPDFSLCVALLSERIVPANADEPDQLPVVLPILAELSQMLSDCRFPAFWDLYRADHLAFLRDNFTVEVVGFEDSIREVVIRAVKMTFTRINVPRLETYLDLEGDELESYVRSKGWSIDNAGVVVIPPNPDNTIEPTIIRESIKLPQLAKLISHAQI